jgi:hypothetical protein
LIFISKSDYTTSNTTIDVSSANVLDYVNVYTSATEYKTLKEIYQGNAIAKIWGENNAVGFQVDANYHGTAVYAVEIKAGAQFPAITNAYTMYEVSADITYYNANYHAADASISTSNMSTNRLSSATTSRTLSAKRDLPTCMWENCATREN